VLKGNPIRGGLQAHSPLSLALAEQPPAPMPPSLLDGTTWGSLLSTSRSTHRYFRTSSQAAARVSRIPASAREVVLLLAQEGGRLVTSLDVAVEDLPTRRRGDWRAARSQPLAKQASRGGHPRDVVGPLCRERGMGWTEAGGGRGSARFDYVLQSSELADLVLHRLLHHWSD
jgi:hypothetical protein